MPKQFYGRLLDTTQWSVKLMIHFPERAQELFRISNRNTTASFWRLCQDENYLLHILSFLFTDAFDLSLVLFLYQYQIAMLILLFVTINLFTTGDELLLLPRKSVYYSEAYLEPSPSSKINHIPKIVTGGKPLTVFSKGFIQVFDRVLSTSLLISR